VNARSGDLLSALIALALSLSFVTSSNTVLYTAMESYSLWPHWAISAALSGLFCLCAAVSENTKAHALARFLSGCVWGTAVLVLGSQSLWLPVFWTALVLLSFDIISVINKGLIWTPKNRF
jgi:hypothetical protein